MNRPIGLNLLVAVLAAAVVTSCGKEMPVADADTSGRPVKLIEIAGSSDENAARYPAVIAAARTAELSFVVGGVIEEVAVSDAQPVANGDLIARLDTRDFESSVTSARASFSNAEEEYQRAVRLATQDAIAQNVLEQRKTQRDVAQAQLDSAEKALADAVLRAPFDGVVASVPARERQTVGAGATIATVINVSRLEATVNLPARVITQIPTQEDRRAAVLLEAAPDQEIAATFSEANLVADATSQTYAVTFTFEPPENLVVLPGMNATVLLKSRDASGTASAAVSVPLAAIQSDGDGQFVWVVDPDTMTASRQDIQVAPGIGETVLVTAGLAPGDRVVGAGGAYLAEGVPVVPWTE